MTATPLFLGRVTGQAVLVLDTPHDYLRHKASLVGKRIELLLRRLREKRSLDQNAYLHAVPVPILCEHFGNTTEEMKLILMGEKWGWVKDKVTGRELPVKPHTSDMTVEEFSALIEWIPMWAMTTDGVTVPLPSEVEL